MQVLNSISFCQIPFLLRVLQSVTLYQLEQSPPEGQTELHALPLSKASSHEVYLLQAQFPVYAINSGST
jgi:hypothetical protein